MKIELSKEDIETAIKAFIIVWFPELEPEDIEFKRNKKLTDIVAVVKTKIKGE